MKLKNALACILLLLATAAMFTFALTFARYSEELGSSGSYGSDLDFIVSDQVEVTNSDEFFSAIENGYSNIKISDDADSSIIITGGVSDVTSDLIIDLNGHELQRNNREPMLNVVDGIRLTIVDTSAEQTGCFYNPVGSVLRVGGGTLTVNAGLFESGPRNGRGHNEKAWEKKSEYAENDGGWRTSAGASVLRNASFTFYEKNGTGDGYTSAGSVSVPVIVPGVTEQTYTDGEETQQTRNLVNGNMYFASAYDGTYIPEDTYLYFTLSDSDAANEQLVVSGSADFYYSYYMRYTEGTGGNPGSYSYVGASSASEDDTLVTIYGYKGVKSSSGSANYAAVQMNSGNIFVRGGEYQTYFGADSTYCIYASGGYMAVEDGSFSALENGVCVNCSYTAAADGDYLRVASGSFYSERGDTVQVSGGNMYVTGGAFTKDATGYAATQFDGTYTNNSAIAISGGTLGIGGDSGIGFTLSGSYVRGITSTGANSSVTAEDCSFEFTSEGAVGTGSMGIYAESGTVNASGCTFVMPGTNSRGISAAGGTVNINGEYSYFYIDEIDGCYGVYAASNGAVTVNVEAAQFFMGQNVTASANTASETGINGAGVYMDAAGGAITLGNALFVTSGNSVSAVYAEQGSVKQDDGKLVLITGAKIPENGYTSGETKFQNLDSYTNEIDLIGENRIAYANAEYAYGIYSGGGTVELNDVYAAVFGGYSAGLLSTNGGNITVGNIDVTVEINKSADYSGAKELSSTAVSTEDGNITVDGTADIDTNGLGITARATSSSDAGNITLYGDVDINSSRGTAIYVNGGDLTLGKEDQTEPTTADITSTTSASYSWVTPPGVSGNAQTTYHGVYVQGGSLTANGTFNVSHTGVENDDQVVNRDTVTTGGWFNQQTNLIMDNEDTLYQTFVTKSFAVYVDSGSGSSGQSSGTVTIGKGNITNNVGGGVYVSGGTVELGISKSDTSLTVRTNGTIVRSEGSYDNNGDGYIPHSVGGNWMYKQSQTGGPAVEVSGGIMTIYGGSYSAAQGDGIRVKGGDTTILGGTFLGNDNYVASDGGPVAGPAASYSFKVIGGTANVYAGTFGAYKDEQDNVLRGSGAFVMGTSSLTGTAYIYGGKFVVSQNDGENQGGQSGFSVYEYANVLFNPDGGETEYSDYKADNITVTGLAAGLVIEGNTSNSATVTINGGTFSSTRPGAGSNSDGIWYNNSNANLTVTDGTFTGTARSGLFLNARPDSNNVQLSGGTFTGGQHAVHTEQTYVYLRNILVDGATATVGNNTYSDPGSWVTVNSTLGSGTTAVITS